VVVLVLDDLDRVDAASLQVLVDVVRWLDRGHVLVCASHTDGGDQTSEWPATGAALLADPKAETLALAGLSREVIRNLLAPTGGGRKSGASADEVFDVTRGNPLFAIEIAQDLRAATPAVEPPVLPSSLEELAGRRIEALPAEVARVLAAASILGDQFAVSVLARVLELDPGRCLDAIGEAAGAGIVSMSAAGRAGFAHQVFRSAVVSRLAPSVRRDLHRRVARALVNLVGASPDDHLGELVHHWSAAAAGGASGEVCAWARRAGDEAMSVLAFGEAERLYLLALEHATGLDVVDRARLQLSAAAAALRCGHLAAARDSCLAAVEVARRPGSQDLLAEAALTLEPLGDATWDGDIHRWCGDALLWPGHDEATRARLLARLTQAAVYLRIEEDADRISSEALRVAERAGDPAMMIEALTARQLATSGPDDVEELEELATRMVAAGAATGRVDAEMWGRLWRIDAHWYAGRLAAIAVETAGLQRCADRGGGPYARWHLLSTRGALAIARAEFDGADRLLGEALRVLEQIRHPAIHGASVMFRLLLGAAIFLPSPVSLPS
jgi:hypothetical protein